MDAKQSPTLVLLSGLPGCGKTTLARKLAERLHLPLLAKDRIQSSLCQLTLADRTTADGYRLMLDLADEQLALGVGAILDGVFPMEGFRAEARAIAERHGAAFRVVYCHCSDEKIWRERMSNRQRYVPHWTPVDWTEVKRLREKFQAWDETQVLRIDAVDDPDGNAKKVSRWIAD